MLINLEEPLNLKETLESGQAHRWHKKGNTYSGVIENQLVHIQQDNNQLSIFSSSDCDLKSLVFNYLRMDDNLLSIYSEISKDLRVKKMTEQYYGLRLIRQDPWECLVTYICSATSNLKRISQVVENMSNYYGSRVALNGDSRNTFPSAIQIANGSEEILRELGLGFRAPYVYQCALKIAEGLLSLAPLIKEEYFTAKDTLMQLNGVGPKIADCVLVFSLEKLQAFPIDVWVKRALLDWYFPDAQNLSNKYLLDWSMNHFGEYAGYSQQYLFHGRRLLSKTTDLV